MDRRYKPLRPALRTARSAGEGGDEPEEPSPSIRRKRIYSKVACDACRVKKTACDARRPLCTSCLKRGSSCTFSRQPGSSGQNTASQSSTPSQKSTPFFESQNLTAILSDSEDTSTDPFRGGLPASHQYSITDLFPPTLPPPIEQPDQLSIEFELILRHSIAFPALGPLVGPFPASAQPSAHLQRDLPQSSSQQSLQAGGWTSSQDDILHPNLSGAPSFCDDRLSQVNYGYWIEEEINDQDASLVISRYLENDHHVFGVFDADLFLTDLVNKSHRYCSPFMVVALLSWSSMRCSDGISGGEHSMSAMGFFTKALSMRENEPLPDSLPSLAALQLLSFTAVYVCRGDMASTLVRESVEMGTRLQLLRGLDRRGKSPRTFSGDTDSRAAAQAAWGLFLRATYHCFHCQRAPFLSPGVPAFPIPDDLSEFASSRSAATSASSHVGSAFPHWCQLWLIIHEIIGRYYVGTEGMQADCIDSQFAKTMLLRLLSWADSLPTMMARGNRATDDTIMLHMYLHIAIQALLRPVALTHGDLSMGLSPLANDRCSEICGASMNQLRHLVVNHDNKLRPTVFRHTSYLYIANYSIQNLPADHARRFYFDVAIHDYGRLYPQYPLALGIIKSLMLMAVNKGLISSQEAYDVVNRVQEKGSSPPDPIEEPTIACLIVDLDLAMTDQNGAHIDSLVQQFDEMAMFDEFTHDRILDEHDIAIE